MSSSDPDSQAPSPTPNIHGLDPGELIARALNTVRLTGGTQQWIPPSSEELARLLPQYQIESMLGHGGMGAVYKGFQPKLERAVAIKLLPAELATDEQFVARFEREARTLARLHHPGIVSVHDFGQTSEGHFYFVMEFVEGTDLRRILQGPGLDAAQALEVVCQICEALQAAHHQGVIHRDVKPANILITTEGRVKLVDFGLALPDREEERGLTHSNVILGTPDYMAPEQRQGSSDHRSDIFALGITLYEMLTGQLPRGAFVAPSRKVQVDVRIDEVVLKALQEEPALRYQHASEMKMAVEDIRNSELAAVVPPEPEPAVPFSEAPAFSTKPESRSRKAVLLAGVVGIILMLGVGGAIMLGRDDRVPVSPAPVAQEALPPISTPDLTPTQATPPLPAQDQPVNLEEALTDFRWDYKTTRPTYSFMHQLVFQKDGTAFSVGRNQQWQWSWTITGPNTAHIDQKFKGFTMDITFDEMWTRFTGKSSEGSTVEGHLGKRLTDDERNKIVELMASAAIPKATASPQPSPANPMGVPVQEPLAEKEPAPQVIPVETPGIGQPINALPESTPAVPSSARQALLDYEWFYNGALDSTMIFSQDGKVRNKDGSPSDRTWTMAGEKSFLLKSGNASTTLTLNDEFTKFEGRRLKSRGKVFGTRLERVGQSGNAVVAEEKSTPTPVPAPTPVRSNIQLLAENGPLITDQVLAPLAEPSVPEATITSWMEDLKDEAASAPAESQPSYRQATALLQAWKSALRERYQMISDTNFSGAVYDTTNLDNSRKSTLHIWDWLMYVRERDDAARHDRRNEQKADFFASGPPKRWADRSVVLRTNIERIYAIFRQLRRITPGPAAPTPEKTAS